MKGNDFPVIETRVMEALRSYLASATALFAEAGDKAVETALASEDYRNVTGNLRSSIGYGVVTFGTLAKTGGFVPVGGGTAGAAKGRAVLAKAAAEAPRDAVALIVVVGEEYWIDVESTGRDVVTGACLAAEALVRKGMA